MKEIRFVLESFEEFLAMNTKPSALNEAKEFELTKDQVKEFTKSVLAKQKELGKKAEIFGKYAKMEDGYNKWLESWKAKDKNKGKDFPAAGETYPSTKFAASFAAPYLWDKLADAEKDFIYTAIFNSARKNGYKNIQELNETLEDKGTQMAPPVIYVFPKTVELPTEVIKGKEEAFAYDFLTDDEEKSVFKDNRWENSEDAYFSPEMKSKMDRAVDQFVSDFASGLIKDVKYINIESSASRYRNTEGAEKISWGELSYNRANSIVQLFKAAADKYDLSEEKRTILQNTIKLNTKGSNGDGTSGPNPVDPIPFGYYDPKGTFVLNNGTFDKNRSTIVMAELGPGGKPTGKYTTKVQEPDASKDMYDEYKYVNVAVGGTALISDEIPAEAPKPKFETTYSSAFKLPAKGLSWWESFKSKFKIRKKPRSKSRLIGFPGGGGNPYMCPEF
jgi:hypothetical protein